MCVCVCVCVCVRAHTNNRYLYKVRFLQSLFPPEISTILETVICCCGVNDNKPCLVCTGVKKPDT